MPYVEVDISLDEFSDEDLLEELERRDIYIDNNTDQTVKHLIEKIYLKRMFGLDFLKEVDDLIYRVVGRIV